jgi:ATP-dependent metalloprotease
LRELHHARIHNDTTIAYTTTTTTTISQQQQQQQRRTFLTSSRSSSSMGSTNPMAQAFSNMSLKRLEREANQAPEDATAQFRFLQELADQHPGAVVERIRNPQFRHCAIDAHTALLYLQALQQTSQTHQLDADELLQRMQRSASDYSAISPAQLQDWRMELREIKTGRSEQMQSLQRLLASGGAVASSASMMGRAGMMNSGGGGMMNSGGGGGGMMNSGGGAMGGRGMDPKLPVHVQVSQAGMGARAVVVTFLARAALMFVAFSAIGAMMDERGLGKGMGMNSGSKHVQEAEQDGRKVKFDDVKGVEEAKQELEEIVMYLKVSFCLLFVFCWTLTKISNIP